MNLRKLILTKNACYKTYQKHTVKGVMVHSTAANNPWLKRYVGPDDGLLGKNQYGNHWNVCHPGGKDIGDHAFVDSNGNGVCDACGGTQVSVHAFIGKLANGTIATYQTLPFDIVGWHAGRGSKGNANFMGYVGFEICEDNTNDRIYFNKVYQEAVEFTAYICKTYNLNPLEDGVVICHSEGHARGIACNHGDVMHWFPKHGKSMDTFRKDVAKLVNGAVATDAPSFKVGDVVQFNGTKHYTSANAPTGFNCKPGKATIKKIYQPDKSKHPYCLVKVSGSTSTVYGWVDEKDIEEVNEFQPYIVKVTADALNIRVGAGVNYTVKGTIKKGGAYTIVEEQNGFGRLKSGAGWIALQYTQKIRNVAIK